jgi:hypothetical protein
LINILTALDALSSLFSRNFSLIDDDDASTMGIYATADALLALAIVLPVLGLLVVGLRFFTRILKKAPLLLDDWYVFQKGTVHVHYEHLPSSN